MNRALWRKAIRDAGWQLVISSALLLLFAWLFVWMASRMEVEKLQKIYDFLPDFIKRMAGDEAELYMSRTGQLSVIFVHLIPLLTMVGWAVGRGSSPISGEIGRGTADLILSLPVRRFSVLVPPAVVATLGTALLAAALLDGMQLGLLTTGLSSHVRWFDLAPGAINLMCMVFAFTGITTFISTFCRDRWRAVMVSGGFYVASFVIKMFWRLWPESEGEPGADWLKYFTFLSAYDPQTAILRREELHWLAPSLNLPLLAIGLTAYLGAAIALTYRDVPTPK